MSAPPMTARPLPPFPLHARSGGAKIAPPPILRLTRLPTWHPPHASSGPSTPLVRMPAWAPTSSSAYQAFTVESQTARVSPMVWAAPIPLVDQRKTRGPGSTGTSMVRLLSQARLTLPPPNRNSRASSAGESRTESVSPERGQHPKPEHERRKSRERAAPEPRKRRKTPVRADKWKERA